MTNAEADQDDLLMTTLVARRLPRTNSRSQLTQFIAISNTQSPARLPSGADGPLKRVEVELKREEEEDFRGLARSPLCRCVSLFIIGEAYVRGDPAEETDLG